MTMLTRMMGLVSGPSRSLGVIRGRSNEPNVTSHKKQNRNTQRPTIVKRDLTISTSPEKDTKTTHFRSGTNIWHWLFIVYFKAYFASSNTQLSKRATKNRFSCWLSKYLRVVRNGIHLNNARFSLPCISSCHNIDHLQCSTVIIVIY